MVATLTSSGALHSSAFAFARRSASSSIANRDSHVTTTERSRSRHNVHTANGYGTVTVNSLTIRVGSLSLSL